MPRTAKDQPQSVAQLRSMMRRWLQRAWIGVGLALLSGLGVALCWHFDAIRFWWVASILGIVSALISICGDINAYLNTKRRVAQIEKEHE